jgi:GTP cyclohydrolase I
MARALKMAEASSPFAPNPSLQEACVAYLLRCIGEDPSRPGLIDTPRRWVKALREMTSGLTEDAESILGTSFEDECGDAIWVTGIRFTSLCEHHLLPFSGSCVVAYAPSGRVVGLSKIPRLVSILARRPQLQERLTREVATILHRKAGAKGTAVAMRAHHSCMGCRGIRQADAEMVTSHRIGDLKTEEWLARILSRI